MSDDNHSMSIFFDDLIYMDDMQYLGTNTILFFLNLYKYKLIEIDNVLQTKASLMTMNKMVDILQNQSSMLRDMQIITQMFKNAQCKPIISFMRTEDWFLIGESVVCMVKQCDDKIIALKCRITNIDISEDRTTIFVKAREKYDFLHSDGSYFGIYSAYSPYIMKQWEYNFLIKNKKFAKIWLGKSKSQEYENKIVNILN